MFPVHLRQRDLFQGALQAEAFGREGGMHFWVVNQHFHQQLKRSKRRPWKSWHLRRPGVEEKRGHTNVIGPAASILWRCFKRQCGLTALRVALPGQERGSFKGGVSAIECPSVIKAAAGRQASETSLSRPHQSPQQFVLHGHSLAL